MSKRLTTVRNWVLINDLILQHPDFILTTDASNVADVQFLVKALLEATYQSRNKLFYDRERTFGYFLWYKFKTLQNSCDLAFT